VLMIKHGYLVRSERCGHDCMVAEFTTTYNTSIKYMYISFCFMCGFIEPENVVISAWLKISLNIE